MKTLEWPFKLGLDLDVYIRNFRCIFVISQVATFVCNRQNTRSFQNKTRKITICLRYWESYVPMQNTCSVNTTLLQRAFSNKIHNLDFQPYYNSVV